MKVLLIESQVNNDGHETTNSGIIRALRKAHPRADLSILSTSRHARAVNDLLGLMGEPAVQTADCLEDCPDPESIDGYRSARRLINDLKSKYGDYDRFLFFSASPPLMTLLAHNHDVAHRSLVILHGSLEVADRGPWRRSVTRNRLSIRVHPGRLLFSIRRSFRALAQSGARLIVLSPHILRDDAVSQLFDPATISAVYHPLAPIQLSAVRSETRALRVGVLGRTNGRTVEQLARESLESGVCSEICVLGNAFAYPYDTNLVKVVGQGRRISRREILEAAASLDVLAFPHVSSQYRRSQSGAILESMNMTRPALFSRNDSWDWANKEFGKPFGLSSSDMSEMLSNMRKLSTDQESWSQINRELMMKSILWDEAAIASINSIEL